MAGYKVANKIKRTELYQKQKKEAESTKRDERHKRRRHEDKNPELRTQRRAKNVPLTIDKKRTWDTLESADQDEGTLGLSIDVLNPKRLKVEPVEEPEEEEVVEDDADSMLDTDEEMEDDERSSERAPSEAPSVATSAISTATDLALTPESLATRFPRLFDPPPDWDPKVLITTELKSRILQQAESLTGMFPNSTFIKRKTHKGHDFSIREISKFAANRDYTHVVVLNQGLKHEPKGLDIVFLPVGPMFHFTITNWIPGDKLAGHGRPTNHYPELILNGFRTPLGLLTAHLFKSLYPPRPEIQGRQVVTLHNQRDYIFVRRHRYVFREKRATEKQVRDAEDKPMKGAEEIRAGLQELGPRFTLKLRRIDKGIQRASGQEYQWKGKDEKTRTRFAL